MNTFAKLATAAAVAGMMAVPMATPSQAAWSHRHHWRGDGGAAAAIGFGAGALLGAAAANAASGPTYYGPDYGYAGYAYEPAPAYGAYAYAPTYRSGWAGSSAVNEHLCTQSPGSVNYVPCDNAGP
jgi:hypothetical protein